MELCSINALAFEPSAVPRLAGNVTQVHLVNQRRGLECLVTRLIPHVLVGQPPQLVIDQGQELGRGV